MTTPTNATPHPEQIGDYRILEAVGEGGMAVVYRGRHTVEWKATQQGGDVAIKRLRPELLQHQEIADRFRGEGRALASLNHPNIVPVYDIFDRDGELALVIRWIPGRTLESLIANETGPIPWPKASVLIGPILDALAHAHAQNIVHRDLKPENIRVDPENKPWLIDFGIARQQDASRNATRAGTGMGTIDYMSPEQYADSASADHRADVYGIAMTLYQMLAGRLPWGAEEREFDVLRRKMDGNFPEPSAFYPAIPAHVSTAIMRCLAPSPADRLQTVADLQAALNGGLAVAPLPVAARTQTLPTPMHAGYPTAVNPTPTTQTFEMSTALPSAGAQSPWVLGGAMAVFTFAVGVAVTVVLQKDDAPNTSNTPPVLKAPPTPPVAATPTPTPVAPAVPAPPPPPPTRAPEPEPEPEPEPTSSGSTRLVVCKVPPGDPGLMVRSAPSTSGYASEALPNGVTLDWLGNSGSWRKVRTPSGTVGWSYGSFLCRAGSSSASAASRPAPSSSLPSYGVACRNPPDDPLLNIRSAPGMHGSILDAVPNGTQLSIVGRSGNWWRVTGHAGGVGYAYSKYFCPSY
jgi:serine/threonine protein kinase